MTTIAHKRPTSKPRRQPARETHGQCFLSTGNRTLPQALDSGDALLTLHTDKGVTNYTVLRLADPDGETVGFRMVKLTQFIVDRTVYDIDVAGKDWLCDCPDATFQSRACKHVRALRAALAANGILVAAPKKTAEAQNYCFECRCPIPPRAFYCDKHNGI